MRARIAACLSFIVLCACSSSGPRSDWERANEARLSEPSSAREAPPALPQKKRGELLEFDVSAASGFRFFVDASSLSLDNEGVVRYVLVARSPTGVENVTFEGMRCATTEVRIYALGRDGAWVGRSGDWRPIEPRGVQRWHNALYREYFCPQREPVNSAAEAVMALRRGGQPLSKENQDPRLGGR